MTNPKLSAAALRAWETKRQIYGPRGHGAVPEWRRKIGSRVKVKSDQRIPTNVPRETSEGA